MRPAPVRPGELDAVVAFIAGQQSEIQRLITYVGTGVAGIRAELDALAPPWTETVRVVRGHDGGIAGAVVVEWDEEAGRSWILGPWVAGDAVAWDDHADDLLDAALAQVPATVTRHELSGEVSNALLGELAAARRWRATEANHAFAADAAVVDAWADEADPFRPPTAADTDAIAPLHDAEFPDTYATAAQLVAGSYLVLVAETSDDAVGGEHGHVAGYAAGRVQRDGEGFIDFVAVAPAARGRGLGRRLVVALTRALFARSTTGRVCLTVQDHRGPALALYEKLGFRPDGSFIAYRSW